MAHLGVARDTVYRWIDQIGLPAHRLGKLWKFKAVPYLLRPCKTGSEQGTLVVWQRLTWRDSSTEQGRSGRDSNRESTDTTPSDPLAGWREFNADLCLTACFAPVIFVSGTA